MANQWYWPDALGDDGFASGPTGTAYSPHTFIYGSGRIVVASAGKATKLAVRCTSASGTPTLKLGLYNSSGNLLAQGTVLNGASPAWREVTIDADIPSGTYTVRVSSETTNSQYYYSTSGNGMGDAGNYADAMPATISLTEDETGTLFGVKVFVEDPTVALTGTATASITESDIVAGGKTVVLTVDGDTYVAASATNIQYVGGQVGSFAGKTASTTVTFALTGGLASAPAANDLVVVSYSVGSTVDRALTIQNASAVNYTLIGSELYQNDSFDSNLRTAYRFMPSPTETTMVLSGTGSTADAGAYTIHVFRGVDSGTPLDVAAVTAGNINTRIPNPGSITPATSGAWLYVVGAAAGGTGGTFTASYLTDFRATNSVDTNDAMIGAGYLVWTSGAYDPAAFAGGGTDTVNDSWNAITVALRPVVTTPFADARAAIRDGLDSAQAEATGWDAKVKPNIPLGNIVRTSDSVVTITLQAQSDYDITAQETITATVPASALVGAAAVVATPTFTVATSGAPSPTRGRISFSEFETAFVATRGRISFTEFETPLTPTRGRVSFSELESPIAPTRGRISWTEAEVPSVGVSPTRGLLAFTEFETPLVATRGRISFAVVETPFVKTRGRLSFTELETPITLTKGQLSFTEFETPSAPTRGRLSFAEFEIAEETYGGTCDGLIGLALSDRIYGEDSTL